MSSNKNILNSLFYLSLSAIAVILYFTFTYGDYTRGYIYQIGFLASLILGILCVYLKDKINSITHMNYLIKYWPQAYDKSCDFKNIYDFHKTVSPDMVNEENFTSIDAQTANDLDLDDVFNEINICMSTAGEQLLYYMLRTPKTSLNDLIKRNNIFKKLSNDSSLRATLQYIYTILGILRKGNIISLLNTKNKKNNRTIAIYSIGALISLSVCIYSLYLGITGVAVFGILALVTQSINIKVSQIYEGELQATAYLRKIMQTAHKLSSIEKTDCDDLNELLETINKHYEPVKSLRLYTIFMTPLHWGMVIEFINSVFFTNLISYQLVLGKIHEHNDDILKLYYYIGQLDAYISIASYRERIDNYCEPTFTEKKKHLKLENAIHPLLLDGVANDIELSSKGLIITGSNMSGKSTFMRTMGLNILLAQSIYTCHCDSYTGSIFNILSSLSISDDVTEGKSYYLGECEALLRILNSCDREFTTFCIIDEIFKGTNPIERIAASKEILKYLSEYNALPIIATHDLEIAEVSKDSFIHKYFCEDVTEEDGLIFDYIIKDGICHTGNALKLLKYLKYPDRIVENAAYEVSKHG